MEGRAMPKDNLKDLPKDERKLVQSMRKYAKKFKKKDKYKPWKNFSTSQ